jgi:transcriptional regulator with XRE-family HTH domain
MRFISNRGFSQRILLHSAFFFRRMRKMKSHFPQALKEVINARGWAQKDAAAAFGLTQGSISAYCNGTRTPEEKQMAQMCEALSSPEAARLLIASMRDTVPSEKFRDLVLLTDTTASETLREEAREQWRSIPLPEETMRHFEILMNAARSDVAIRDLVASFASILKPEPNEP